LRDKIEFKTNQVNAKGLIKGFEPFFEKRIYVQFDSWVYLKITAIAGIMIYQELNLAA